MIVKERDANNATIAHLEQMEFTEKNVDQRLCIRHAKARLRASSTTDHACEVIDDLFSDTGEWMVLHDLRLSVKGKMFYVNHLLINDSMEFYIVDSRYIECGLTVSSNGTWRAHTARANSVVASPVNKLHRDIRYLKTHLKNNDVLPRYFGVIRPSSIKGFILTNPAIRSSKSPHCEIDTSSVVATDSLFRVVWKETEHWFSKHLKPEPSENLHLVASKLEGMHDSHLPTRLMRDPATETVNVGENSSDTAHCSDCGVGVCETVREQCFRHMEEYKSKILCNMCQTKYLEHKSVYASH